MAKSTRKRASAQDTNRTMLVEMPRWLLATVDADDAVIAVETFATRYRVTHENTQGVEDVQQVERMTCSQFLSEYICGRVSSLDQPPS